MNRVLLFVAFVATLNCLTFAQHNALSNKFTLKFDYAAKQGVALKKNNFVVLWNGVKLAEIFAKDFYTRALKFNVEAKEGENILNFAGKNVQIDNVELIRQGRGEFGRKDDVLVNGDFSEDFKSADGKSYNAGQAIQGWMSVGGSIQLGWGRNFNKEWPNKTPVLKFKSSGSDVYQSVFFNKKFEQVSDDQTTH